MQGLGCKVAKLRAEHKWTLKRLSKESGVSFTYISAIEKGKRPNPSFNHVERLAQALGVPLNYFSDSTTDTDDYTQSSPADLEALTLEVAARLNELYDERTCQFILSEQSAPYVSLAKQLAEQSTMNSSADLLQLIAQFIRERKTPYTDASERA